MVILKNYSLKNYNTFGIDVHAKEFIEVKSIEELQLALKNQGEWPIFLLGGGSNMLLTKNLDYRVIYINIRGIYLLKETDTNGQVKVMAGENWHDFVNYTIDKNYGGLENLSLIPGHVGTSPVQNIGAYGVELKDVMLDCEAMEISTQKIKSFTNADCRFGYRDSIFKNELKNKYIILSVTFELSKPPHQLKTTYGAIGQELAKNHIPTPTIKDVSQAVIAIRQSKLPDPKILGNCGSFFKNPIISSHQYKDLQNKYPTMPNYPIDENLVKIPAGWLIEQAGLKGYRQGDAGVHEKQALVLVNYGQATGSELLTLSKYVQNTVHAKFGIQIEAEVNIL
jgi:UDP-N-acetylmuramate dehydrogenase